MDLLAQPTGRQQGEHETDVGPAELAGVGVPRTDCAVFFESGLERLQAGEYESAIAAFSKALQLNPFFVPALVRRGDVRRLQGESAEAQADYSRALQINPKDTLVLVNRGRVLS